MENEGFFEANRRLWNARTSVHAESEFYRVEQFKKGNTSLNSIELNGVGDVQGKALLHLQCHFGMDTLSWARRGAIATGADISDESITLAESLNDEMQLNAKFVRSNIYDLKENLNGEFDIVFTSYGTVGWLPDLDKWADIVAHFLKPGGMFYIVDFHPVMWMFDDLFEDIIYSYFNKGVIRTEIPGTYADRDAEIFSVEYGWNHSLSEIIGSLLKHGLKVTAFNEYDHSPFNCFRNMAKGDDGNYRIKKFSGKLPMVFELACVKG